ncbi:MAG: N-acetyl sugar amidotransferase [bacterium]|nr:N-acetyl sugar amidotransferase [bacterium]
MDMTITSHTRQDIAAHGGRTIQYCTRCVMPNSRPRIVFDAEGVCNACRYAERKWDGIDWAARRAEFLALLDQYRADDGSWDCIVPWSGGKDSSAIAYKLKHEFGMNPLLVTFSPQLPTAVGLHNYEAMIQAGFDHHLLRPDQRIHRHLARRFFLERGNHKIAWDAGINATPVQAAVRYGIPLVLYAEHGESEYGGKVLREDSAKVRDFTEVIEHQIGDDPRNWVDDVVTERDLNPYRYPAIQDIQRVGVRAYYFAYFFKWSSFENYEYIKDKIDFQTCAEGRTEGTFTDFDSLDDKSDNLYYYLQYVKFGFGRAIRDASRMIQNKQLTRERGLAHARAYDHEFPARYYQDMLAYLHLTDQEFTALIDRHRNAEIWKQEGGEWQLRFPPV